MPPERRGELDQSCWMGLLAVEMVHEASLLHDDLLDEAPERRGRPTLVAASGVGPALVLGDHLLTTAYGVAAGVGSTSFMEAFVRAVERTVAGEIAQERSQGRVLAADLDRREAYAGQVTGVGLLDEVLGEMGRSGVPSRYAEGLVEGVRMDLFPSRYQTLRDLWVYSFRGALDVVRAKHARWPPTKLAHLREGMGILDRMVEEEPEDLEVRYLRLVSCYHLPFFLKREESVQEDLRILAVDLPHSRGAFSPAIYRGVVQFVMDHGELSARERALLRESLDSHRDSISLRASPAPPLPGVSST